MMTKIYDISQYEFEENCEKFAFYLYERSLLKKGEISKDHHDNYSKYWDGFRECGPKRHIEYRYTTSLGTEIWMEWDETWTLHIKHI